MQTLLNDEASDYKLIDLKFRPINEARFQDIILAETGHTKVINVRLIRVIDDNPLTLAFAEKKLSDCVRDTIILVGLTGVLAELRAREVRLRKENADATTIEQHKVRIKRFTEMVWEHRRSRMLNRLLLYAARCQILDPLPRRRERSRDRGEVHRLATHGQETERDLEEHHERDRKHQRAKKLTSSTGSELETEAPPIPKIVIDGETTSGTKTPMLRQTVLDFRSLSRSHTSTSVTSQTSDSARKEHAMQPPPTVELRDHHILPSSKDPSRIRRGSTTQAHYTKLSGRPETSPGGPIPTIVAAGLPISSLPDFESDEQERHGPLIFRRGHSTANHQTAAPGKVLPASPQRLPLRSEGDSAILIPSRLAEKVQTVGTGIRDQWLFKSSLAVPETPTPNLRNNDHESIFQTVHSQARRKSRERFNGPTPFFEVRTSTRSAENVDVKHTDTSTAAPKIRSKDDQMTDGQARSTGNEGSSWDHVNDILSSIDDLICDGDFGKHSHSLASAIKPNQYNEIELKSESDVISMLEKCDRDAKQSSPHQGYDHVHGEFLKAKIELFLGVHGLVGCFIHHEVRSEAKIVGKIWGIVYLICELNPHSMPVSRATSGALTLSPPKHDIQYIDLARREVRRFEQKWKSLLIQIRHGANGEGTALSYQVRQSLLPAFRNIVLFLLCALLAVNENAIDLDIFNIARDKLNDGIRESEAAFLRMTELAEMASDQIGDESIRTADTLLGLLLENAFAFSSRKHVDETGAWGKMSLDIEHIYSTYTSQCVSTQGSEAERV